MPSPPATPQDIKHLLTDLGSDIKQSLGKRLDHIDHRLGEHDKRFDHIDKRFTKIETIVESISEVNAEHYADVTDRLDDIDAKLNHLLTDTRYDQLARRLTQVEQTLYGNRPS